VGLIGWGSDDGEDLVDVGVEEALAQDALAYHAGCSEENYVHGFMLQRGGCRAEGARSHERESVSDSTAFLALCQSDLEGRRCEWKPTTFYMPAFDYLSRIWADLGKGENTSEEKRI
jgi:hypothetical protein